MARKKHKAKGVGSPAPQSCLPIPWLPNPQQFDMQQNFGIRQPGPPRPMPLGYNVPQQLGFPSPYWGNDNPQDVIQYQGTVVHTMPFNQYVQPTQAFGVFTVPIGPPQYVQRGRGGRGGRNLMHGQRSGWQQGNRTSQQHSQQVNVRNPDSRQNFGSLARGNNSCVPSQRPLQAPPRNKDLRAVENEAKGPLQKQEQSPEARTKKEPEEAMVYIKKEPRASPLPLPPMATRAAGTASSITQMADNKRNRDNDSDSDEEKATKRRLFKQETSSQSASRVVGTEIHRSKSVDFSFDENDEFALFCDDSDDGDLLSPTSNLTLSDEERLEFLLQARKKLKEAGELFQKVEWKDETLSPTDANVEIAEQIVELHKQVHALMRKGGWENCITPNRGRPRGGCKELPQ